MFRTRSRRPSHSIVVAYLALFVALGGSSYAAVKVSSKQIADNTIRSKDLRNNDVRSADVRNGSLLARDFATGQIPAGARGPEGARGPQGLRGPNGATNVIAREGHGDSGSPAANADCLAGETAVGGGGHAPGGGDVLWYSRPRLDADARPYGWRVEVADHTTGNGVAPPVAVVLCARP